MKDFVTPNKSKHQYIIGIDFGHGETSADICNIQWDDNYLSLSAPEPIEIFNGQHATKSALLIVEGLDINNRPTLSYYVGQQAIEKYGNRFRLQSSYQISQFYSYFKKIPSLMNEAEREVMQHFMRGIYQQIRSQRSELTDDNHIVYIACPSNATKWTNEEMAKYAEIALEAGIPLAKIGPNNIGIIRESRAAFIKARSNPNSKTAVKDGFLLIDFGSSTVDLTYYSSSLQRPIDGGADCGAQRVEKEILVRLKEDCSLAATCSTDKFGESAMLLEIREAKEKYYTYNSQDLEIDIKARKVTGGRISSGSIETYYSPEEIDALLQQYKESIAKCFTEFRDEHLKNRPIKLVYMTGGASRMEFIQDIVRQVFNYEGTFYRETNPSLTISNGIALAGRADIRSTVLLEKLMLAPSLSRSKDISTDVINAVSNTMAESLVDKISCKYEAFATQAYPDNIASLERQIQAEVKGTSIPSFLSDKFKEVLKTEINRNILPSLNSIVGDYFQDGSIKEISSSRYISASFSIDDVNFGGMISDSVNEITEGFWEGMGVLAARGVVGVISVPLGILNSAVAVVHNQFFDNNWETNIERNIDELCDELPDWRDKETYLDRSKREAVRNKFRENKSTYKIKIQSEIKSKLDSDNNLKTQLNSTFREEAIKYVREQIDLVRLMLN